jgi:hypothetical protein
LGSYCERLMSRLDKGSVNASQQRVCAWRVASFSPDRCRIGAFGARYLTQACPPWSHRSSGPGGCSAKGSLAENDAGCAARLHAIVRARCSSSKGRVVCIHPAADKKGLLGNPVDCIAYELPMESGARMHLSSAFKLLLRQAHATGEVERNCQHDHEDRHNPQFNEHVLELFRACLFDFGGEQ